MLLLGLLDNYFRSIRKLKEQDDKLGYETGGKMMQEYDPLTPSEVNDAAKEFFPLFDIRQS